MITPKSAPRVRILDRRGSRDDRSPRVAHTMPAPGEGTICTSCGAVFRHKTWRHRMLPTVVWTLAPRGRCPACLQVASGRAYGEVRLRAEAVFVQRREVLRRLRHVAERAAFTQPERRIVAVFDRPEGLDVFTTSQKLAHRLALELRKAFGGRTRYRWSDRGGRLICTWEDARGGSAVSRSGT